MKKHNQINKMLVNFNFPDIDSQLYLADDVNKKCADYLQMEITKKWFITGLKPYIWTNIIPELFNEFMEEKNYTFNTLNEVLKDIFKKPLC